MKKLFLLFTLMVLPLVASADDSGSCGNNVTYTYVEATNTLTISGTGAMTDYTYTSSSYAPWYSYSSSIKTAIIENGVTSIGDNAFYGCIGLSSITIGNSVKNIGEFAFEDCSSLTSVNIPNSVKRIRGSAFSGCSGLTSVTIPNSVTSIGEFAFDGCSILTSITIPNSVTSIGDYAFQNCNGLTSVTIPNSVTRIGERVFYGCSGLISVAIPISVTSIGADAFCGCSSLTSVTIPTSVTSIGDYAFRDCSGLTSITIPNSVTSIGNNAFNGCCSLTSVELHCKGIKAWFSGNPSIKEIIIGSEVTGIEGSAFENCSGLTSITIPNSVTSIGYGVFKNCSGLTSITIPNSVTSIGNWAFANCSSLSSIVVESGNTVYDSRENCNAIIHTKTNELRVGCKNTIIPNSVTSIRESAFFGSGLISVTIPNSVTSIGQIAFAECISLTSVTIPNTVNSIVDGVFSGCSGLTSIVFSNYVTSIGKNAFSGCSGLTSIVIPNSMTSIDKNAFYGCNGLTYVEFHCNTISDWFSGNTSIKNVVLGAEVTSINDNAFKGCDNLATLEIGKSVISVGMRAFANIGKLSEVTCYAENVPTTDRTAFENSYTDYATLHVPYASVDKYKAVGPWNGFNIVALPKDKYTLTYLVDGEVYKTNELAPGAAITAEAAPTKSGYKFSGWSAIPATMPSEDVVITGSFEKVYDVGDLTGLLKYIMNRAGGVFSQLFDLNGDGELNIGDIVLMVKKIHQNQAARATARARAASSLSADVDLSQYTAVQFILSTDEQAKVSAIRLKGKNRETHRVSYEPMGNGQYSVVVYSTTNQLLTVEEDGLLEVELADGNVSSEITTSNVVLSTPDSECLTMDSLPTGATTGINSLDEEADGRDVYNLNGSKEPKQGLRKGIYIIRGKKTVVR